MKTPELHDQTWPYVVTLLPPDFEERARSARALVRCRNIPNATALLRLALAYAVSDLSLKDVAAWAHALEVAEISGPGLFYRLRESQDWLEEVLAGTLQAEVGRVSMGGIGRIRIADATVITGPGSKGTDWRVHVQVDPATGALRSVQVTDAHGGESYGRLPSEEGDVVLGDQGYARARGIAAVRQAQAHVVVRISPHSIRLCNPERKVLRLAEMAAGVPQVGPQEWPVLVPVPPDHTSKKGGWTLSRAKAWVSARLVAARTRKGEVIWLLTTLELQALPATDVLRLYRLRWQVELAFKRLKSLLHLDNLPSRQGPTAKSWLLARLLAAALAQRLARPAGSLSPWGYELREVGVHP